MITRTISPEQFATIENSITELDQAAGMLAIMQDALAAPDGSPDSADLTEAVAGIERNLRNISQNLDKLASEIMKSKLEVTGEDLTPTTAQFLKN